MQLFIVWEKKKLAKFSWFVGLNLKLGEDSFSFVSFVVELLICPKQAILTPPNH